MLERQVLGSDFAACYELDQVQTGRIPIIIFTYYNI